MALINPYNFLPLKQEPERIPWNKVAMHHRIGEESYSGRFEIVITALTPIFTPSRLSEDVEKATIQYQTRQGPRQGTKITFKKFQHRNGQPTISGSSLKGMIRSVFEALSNSCMALFTEQYGRKKYPSAQYKNSSCNIENGLCPSCCVFGTLMGEELHFQGNVSFSDAIASVGDIERGDWVLKELSSPKPERHDPFYGKNGRDSSGPRGRKFYYHHDFNKVFRPDYVTQREHNQRNVKIEERLKRGAKLNAKVEFSSLSKKELSLLFHAIELDLNFVEESGQQRITLSMGHKIGMAKPLGLGSVYIRISDGVIEKGNQRYQQFDRMTTSDLRTTIDSIKQGIPISFSSRFTDLFSLDFDQKNEVQYPDFKWFKRNSQTQLPPNGIFQR